MPKSGKRYSAFGKSLTISEWAKQKECRVSHRTLRHRITESGWGIVAALTTPGLDDAQPKITAFGETKTIPEWARKRDICPVQANVIRWRINSGWSPEDAISKPPCTSGPLEHTAKRRGPMGMQITAFGETKETAEWAEDPRCAVCRETLYARLRRGWPPEVAIAHVRIAKGDTTEELAVAVEKARASALVTAFGLALPVDTWARDSRCVVSLEQLEARLAAGWHPEDALATPLFRGNSSE